MAKVYAIISGKGGVGKTTTAVNLGASLNHLGEEVIIVDANLTTPNVGIHLGAPILPITINHVLKNQAKFEEAIYEHESGTKIMPASLSLNEIKKIDYKKLNDLMKKLKKIANYILIDSAAGLGEEAISAINASDEIIIVTNPEMSSVTDALKTIKLAEEKNKPILGAILTRYNGHEHDMSIKNIMEMLEIPILGVIPEDNHIRKSQYLKNPVIYTHPKSKSAQYYINTSKRILGEEIPEPQPGFFRSILKAMGFK